MNDTPVFIGGLQRSGTSLMRAIIGSHPDIAIYPSDLPLWTDLYNRYKDLDLNNRDQCDKLMHAIQSNERVQQCQVRIDFNALRNKIGAEPQLTINLVFGHFIQAYAREIGRPRWGLKTPYNEFFSEAIFSAFPNAKMIQLIRDPRDVAVSYKSYQKGAWKWKYNILLHIREWKQSVRLARENEIKYPGAFMAVRYEDLVLHPEKTIRQVCQRIHLDYTPELLEMSGQIGWTGANSFFQDISRNTSNISKSAIGRYKNNLPRSHIWLYQRFLKNELRYWHYDHEPVNLLLNDIIAIVVQPAFIGLSLVKITFIKLIAAALRDTPLYNASKNIFLKLNR
ncbi:MAG: sulfotransferase [Deltaproteobacteria bacterium]|nr:MAG: sulfotransferase [Deltaproteobacteria bacterium]